VTAEGLSEWFRAIVCGVNLLNNEHIGVSAEIAIADVFGVPVADAYRSRGVPIITSSIFPIVGDIFADKNIPLPIRHVAERQNPTDFMLANGQTLSVKTNKQKLGKAAPQRIGQASSKTWFLLLAGRLGIASVPLTYPEKVVLFKMIALTKIDKLLAVYWENMFDCDYLLHIFNVVDKFDVVTGKPEYIVMKKTSGPVWDKAKVTFTKPTAATWNESNTVKYDGVTIGEFQVHNNRDNFKFRFNMAGITKLMQENRLTFSSE
jgi:hypothetical protein